MVRSRFVAICSNYIVEYTSWRHVISIYSAKCHRLKSIFISSSYPSPPWRPANSEVVGDISDKMRICSLERINQLFFHLIRQSTEISTRTKENSMKWFLQCLSFRFWIVVIKSSCLIIYNTIMRRREKKTLIILSYVCFFFLFLSVIHIFAFLLLLFFCSWRKKTFNFVIRSKLNTRECEHIESSIWIFMIFTFSSTKKIWVSLGTLVFICCFLHSVGQKVYISFIFFLFGWLTIHTYEHMWNEKKPDISSWEKIAAEKANERINK